MYNAKEMLPYVSIIAALMSYILAVTLVSSTSKLIGRGWLLAFTIIMLVTAPAVYAISLIVNHSNNPQIMYQWIDILRMANGFGLACFGFFLLCNWSMSRMSLDITNLLFSFSGRIPRSVFWASMCILFPLGAIIGFAPFTTKAQGIPKIIIWVVYYSWMILSIWSSLAVYTKRWHDCSRSAWMSLLLIIPVIGPFWFFGYLGFVRGTIGSNKYGEDSFISQ